MAAEVTQFIQFMVALIIKYYNHGCLGNNVFSNPDCLGYKVSFLGWLGCKV